MSRCPLVMENLFCYQYLPLLFDALQSHEVPTCSCNSIGSNYERSSGGADLWNINFQVFLINAHQKSVTSCIPRRTLYTPSSPFAKGAGHETRYCISLVPSPYLHARETVWCTKFKYLGQTEASMSHDTPC